MWDVGEVMDQLEGQPQLGFLNSREPPRVRGEQSWKGLLTYVADLIRKRRQADRDNEFRAKITHFGILTIASPKKSKGKIQEAVFMV
jgi:hypothetical protein